MLSSPWQKPVRGIQLNKAHPLAKGLVGCWVMNEAIGNTVFDLSGNGNNGTKSGVTWVDNGMEFNGSSDYVSVGSPSSLLIGPELTMYARIYRHTTSHDYEGIATYVRTSPDYGGYGLWSMADGKFRGCVDDSYLNDVRTTNIYSDNTWYDLVVRCNGTTYSLYVDGIKASSDKSIVSYDPATPTEFRIGRSVTGTEYFDGVISRLYIYDRALTSDEIMWLYREPYSMFEPDISSSLLYVAAAAGELTIPIAMYHYLHH